MKRYCVLALVAGFASPVVTEAQTAATVPSGGSDMVVTVWAPDGPPEATLLLVPGWAGGPEDALGIGRGLSTNGVSVVVLTPRGWHGSGGTSTFANALDDIGVTLEWIRGSTRPDIAPEQVVLGGYSWGGGMAMAYAARDGTVGRVFSIAGTDHGQFIRQYESDPTFAEMVDGLLGASAAPAGPIRFDVDHGLREMAEGQNVYGLIENAEALSDRSVMLVGGWDDANVTIDDTLLPLYRALRRAGAEELRFDTFHDDHGFGSVRTELHAALLEWIR